MTNIFEVLGATLESATQHYASQHSAALALAIFPYVSSGILVWLTIMGFQTISGRLQAPFINVVERCGAITFLAAIAFGSSIYQVEILNDFDALQNALLSAVSGLETTPYKAADAALQRGLDLATEFSHETSITGLETFYGWAVGSLIIYGGTVILTTMAAGSIMIAKANLAIALAFGQIAIACAMFPATRKIFDAFITTVLNRIVYILVISMVLGFALDIFSGVAAGYTDAAQPLAFAWELLIAVVVCGLLIWSAGSLASELAGGVALAVSNPIMAAARMAGYPATSAMRYLNGQSSRTNAVTGQQEYASRASHIARGNTALNPAYRQKAAMNMQNGWGPSSGGEAKPMTSSQSNVERIKAMAKKRDDIMKK
ncbi:type IV secretion system protein [Methylovorus mays]|uniref:type IV secretion system protein n=1 Tax=Methylovorus mays TaxID=184077 RepID=UPI001E2CEC83|nr:type IV secretion system protein [Methylovorus mays]MCB5206716.1 type IV secretion system protein [Methylovorus mays]